MKKSRYTLLAFAVVAALFIFQYAFLAPKSDMMKESIESGQRALLRERQFIVDAARTAGSMDSLMKDTKSVEGRLLGEKSDFLDSAKLQGEVSGIAGKSGLHVLTIRPLPSSKLGKFTVISVYFEGDGDIKQMSEFLRGIEQDKLLIKTDKLNITITNVQNPKDLKYKIQVSALART